MQIFQRAAQVAKVAATPASTTETVMRDLIRVKTGAERYAGLADKSSYSPRVQLNAYLALREMGSGLRDAQRGLQQLGLDAPAKDYGHLIDLVDAAKKMELAVAANGRSLAPHHADRLFARIETVDAKLPIEFSMLKDSRGNLDQASLFRNDAHGPVEHLSRVRLDELRTLLPQAMHRNGADRLMSALLAHAAPWTGPTSGPITLVEAHSTAETVRRLLAQLRPDSAESLAAKTLADELATEVGGLDQAIRSGTSSSPIKLSKDLGDLYRWSETTDELSAQIRQLYIDVSVAAPDVGVQRAMLELKGVANTNPSTTAYDELSALVTRIAERRAELDVQLASVVESLDGLDAVEKLARLDLQPVLRELRDLRALKTQIDDGVRHFETIQSISTTGR